MGHSSFLIAPAYRFRPFGVWIEPPFHLEAFAEIGLGYWEHQQTLSSLGGAPFSSTRLSGFALPIRVGADIAVWDRLRVGASLQLGLILPAGNSAGQRDANPAAWFGMGVDVRYSLPFEVGASASEPAAATGLEVRFEARRATSASPSAAPPALTVSPEYTSAAPSVRTVALLPPDACQEACVAGVEALERALSAAGYRVVPWRTIVEGRRTTGSATGTAAAQGCDVLFQVHRLAVEAEAGGGGRWSRRFTAAEGLSETGRAEIVELARAAEAGAGARARVTLDVEAILIAARSRVWRYRAQQASGGRDRIEATFRRAPEGAPQDERYVMPPAHCQPDACADPSPSLECAPALCGQWFRWSAEELPASDGAAAGPLLTAMAAALAATFRSGGDVALDASAPSAPEAADSGFGLAPEPPVEPPPLPEGAER